MILGILAAIAAPRMLGASQQAVDGGVKQSLSVVRNAIDQFSAEHPGMLPGADSDEATFKADLAPYLRGLDFPKCPVGAAQNNEVRMLPGSGPIAGNISGTDSLFSWVYLYETGEFHINSAAMSNDGVTTYDQF